MKHNTTKKSQNAIKVLGIDLAKQSFHIHGVDEAGETVLSKKLTRKQLIAFTVKLPPCLIGLEACGGAHDWVRKLTGYGHTVRMIAKSGSGLAIKHSCVNLYLLPCLPLNSVHQKQSLFPALYNHPYQRLFSFPPLQRYNFQHNNLTVAQYFASGILEFPLNHLCRF